MERIETGNPARLHFQDPIGWWVVLTIPFFGGLIALQGGMFLHFAADQRGSAGGLELVFGLIFLLLLAKVLWGGITSHLRRALEIDAQARTATTSWGLLVPMVPTTHDLSGAIALRSAMRVVDHGRYKEFFYDLFAVTPRGEIKLAQSKDALELGNLGEDVAAALKLDLLEIRNGDVVCLRRADEAGKHVLQLNAPPVLEALLEDAPPLETVRVDTNTKELSVSMDGSGAGSAAFVKMLALLYAGGLCILWSSGVASGACVAATILATILYGIFYFIFQPEWPSLHARPGNLEIRRRGMIFTSRKAYPVSTIRSIQAKGRLLTIDSSKGGESLVLTPAQTRERAWLRDAVLAALAQSPA